MKRVLVCGGRDYDDYKRLVDVLDEIAPDLIINGGCAGADHMASNYAIAKRIPAHTFFADWEEHGKAAGPVRNQKMIDVGRPSVVVAFPGGKGTADMVRRAKKAGIPLIEVLP
jgi:hypothetical protein